MTEHEWLTAISPEPMLEFLRGRASERKLRLFAVACCGRIRHLLRGSWSHDCLNAAEKFADGQLSRAEMREMRVTPGRLSPSLDHPPTSALAAASHEGQVDVVEVASLTADSVADTEAPMGSWQTVRAAEQRAQANIIRDIFENPFSVPAFEPSYRTATAVAIARQAYDTREFAALMPILADALADAGAEEDSEVLRHCRGPGLHYRGCHVVDWILDKS